MPESAIPVLIPHFYAYLVYGSAAMAGMCSIVLAGIYLFQIYGHLDRMITLEAQVVTEVGRMGLAVVALEQLAKENRTDFANAALGAIDAIKLLRHEIELQAKIEEIHRRKRDTEREQTTARGNNGEEYQWKPSWDQP